MNSAARYIGPIPVRNLWWLMLYASELYRVDAGVAQGGSEAEEGNVADLVGRTLNACVEMRLRRQLTQRFAYRASILPRVRGRIDLLKTTRRSLLQQGKVACRFPILSVDTSANRLVQSALKNIATLATKPQIYEKARSLAYQMRAAGVPEVQPTHSELVMDHMHDEPGDRRMLAAARLALDLAIPVEGAGTEPQPIPDRTIQLIRRLFERAVRGFYGIELKNQGWTADSKRFDWGCDRKQLSSWLQKTLPYMQTDIVLDNLRLQRRIVIDTKFNSIEMATRYRVASLRSEYLYQIYAYLQTQVGRHNPLADSAEGLLLHPSVGVDRDESISVQGHRIRFATVDLRMPGVRIRERLLYLIDGVLPSRQVAG